MDFKGKVINGTRIMGYEAIRLFNTNAGILVFMDKNLYFSTIVDGKPKVTIKNTADEATEPIMFVSDDFDLVHQLKRDKLYVMAITSVSIEFYDYKTGDVVLIIPGNTFP